MATFDLNSVFGSGMTGNSRPVRGRTAYWQRDPGWYIDVQTGGPLVDREAMDPGRSGGGDYVYGESYGGIEQSEQAQLNALRNYLLQQEQMRQRAQEAAQAREDRFGIARMNLGAQLAQSGLARQDAQRNLMARLRQSALEEAGRNKRATEANQIRMLLGQDPGEDLAAIDEAGTDFSSDISRLLPMANQAAREKAAADLALKQARAAADADVDNRILDPSGSGGYAPFGNDASYRDAAILANRNISQKADTAKATAQALNAILKDLDPLMRRQIPESGFQIDPRTGAVVDRSTGRRFPINIPQAPPPPRPQSRAGRIKGSYFTPLGG